MSDLAPLEAYCSALITNLQPAERRKLARLIAQGMRSSQAKRIAAQLNPDGTPYAPRKKKLRTKKGGIRRTMFAKLRTAKYLKTQVTADSSVVAFADQVQYLARVHHYGLRDKVNRGRRLEVDYPKRELLGFSKTDVDLVKDLVVDHLAR